MATLVGIVLFFLVCALLLGRVVRLISTLAGRVTPSISGNPEFAALPYSKRKYFFSAAERSFYEILRRLVPGHTVFAKVRLADVVCVSNNASSWQSHFNRIDRKHLDFILCDSDLAPVMAIELDDRSHDDEDRKLRDRFVDQVMASVSLPIVRIRAKRAYNLEEVRRVLAPHVRAQLPVGPVATEVGYLPPKGWRPAV